MKKLIKLLILIPVILISNNAYSQNIVIQEYIFPAEDGDVQCVLLTKQGFENLLKRIEKLEENGNNGGGNGNRNGGGNFVAESDHSNEWDSFVSDLKSMTVNQFKRAYTEVDIVRISNLAPVDLPAFLKNIAGPVADKRDWYQKNKSAF